MARNAFGVTGRTQPIGKLVPEVCVAVLDAAPLRDQRLHLFARVGRPELAEPGAFDPGGVAQVVDDRRCDLAHIERSAVGHTVQDGVKETRPGAGRHSSAGKRDARKQRGERPFVLTNLKTRQGLDTVVRFIEEKGMLGA